MGLMLQKTFKSVDIYLLDDELQVANDYLLCFVLSI